MEPEMHLLAIQVQLPYKNWLFDMFVHLCFVYCLSIDTPQVLQCHVLQFQTYVVL